MKNWYVNSYSLALASIFIFLMNTGCSISAALNGVAGESSLVNFQKVYLDMTTATITEGSVIILNVAVDQIQSTDTVVNVSLTSSSIYSRFNPLPAQITIPAGQLSKSIVLNTIDDSIPQAQETWTLSISSVSTSITADPGTLVITLNDNDGGGSTSASGLVQLKEFNPAPAAITGIKFKQKMFFANADAANGNELWISDGTTLGTHVLVDINPGIESSNPSGFFIDSTDTYLYFSAKTLSEGTELWRTDGTAAGTLLVADIEPGALSAYPALKYSDSGLTYFAATNSVYGNEIWVTDGTPAGTHILKDIEPGPAGFRYVGGFTKWNGLIYFGIGLTSSYWGSLLYTTDGTTIGTTLAVDLIGGNSMEYDSPPHDFVEINGKLVFSTETWATGNEIFVTDGTNAGTILLKNIYTGNSWGSYASATHFELSTGNFVSISYDDNASYGFYVTNGTAGGTTKVLAPATIYSPFGMINGDLVFSGYSSPNNVELWKTDGTIGGTTLLKEIEAGGTGSYAGFAAQIGNKILFTATTAAEGTELYVTDGTPGGTMLLKDIYVGSQSSSPGQFAVVNGKAYFRASSATEGVELWETDGTPSGTQILKDINPGTGSSSPISLYEMNSSTLFFAAYNPTVSFATIYISDLTSSGTFGINHAFAQTLNSETKTIFEFNGKAYFDAMDSSTGNPLWSSDGTAAGTTKITDLNPNITCSDINYMFSTNGSLFFTGTSDASGKELFITDGTTAGTSVLKEIEPGSGSAFFGGLFVKTPNNSVFFNAGNLATGTELWFTDGTTGNTKMVKDLTAGTGTTYIATMKVIPGTNSVIFAAAINGTSWGIYTSDGTNAGTLAVPGVSNVSASSVVFYPKASSVIFSATDSSNYKVRYYEYDPIGNTATLLNTTYTTDLAQNVAQYNSRLGLFFYFTKAAGNVAQIWKSDGTPGGTVVVATIPNVGNNYGFSALFDTGTKQLFIYYNATTSWNIQLWETDGTNANTLLVKDFTGIAASTFIPSFFDNGIWYMNIPDIVNGTELWKTDGTTSGTQLVKDINPGTASSSPSQFVAFNGKVYFSADDGTHGVELWETDGTTSGTVLFEDINPGSSSSSPSLLRVIAGKLYFVADKVLSGREVWTYTP
jgi:ELWxxDGT repeat protein